MKNKKAIALLTVLALVQLLFPPSFLIREKLVMDEVAEKGKSYTLEYTMFQYFNAEYIHVNTDNIYTVGYKWDRDASEFSDYFIPHNTVSVYSEVGISENEKGETEFFDTGDRKSLTDENWFKPYRAFHIELKDYDFVNEELGLKELFDLSVYLGDNHHNLTYETFLNNQDGYYLGIFDAPLEGKIVLKVYKGFARISELYLGNELILKLK